MPLIVTILLAIIKALGTEITLAILKALMIEWKRQRDALTPEERAKWDRQWTDDFKVGE